jgi:hypothetical protein
MGVPVEVASKQGWSPSPEELARLRPHLAREYEIKSLTSCSTCHR